MLMCSIFVNFIFLLLIFRKSKKINKNDISLDEISKNNLEKFPVNGTPFDVKNLGATENMIKRSLLSKGNFSRFKEILDVAATKHTKICFLGDSITAGSECTSSEYWFVNNFEKWFRKNISENVEVKNAGIGATDSYLGVHRLKNNVLDFEPDIVFIEFINDRDTEFYKTTMDNIVHRLLESETKPAVIMLEMTKADGSFARNAHRKAAEFYKLPVVSYHDAVIPEIEAKNFLWRDISPDSIHPTNFGHKLVLDFLTNFFDEILKSGKTAQSENHNFLTTDVYADADILNRKSTKKIEIIKDDGWENYSWSLLKDAWKTDGADEMKLKIKAKNIGIAYWRSNQKDFGNAKITIDGKTTEINGDFPNGWGSYLETKEIFTSKNDEWHEINVEIKPNNAGEKFIIFGWLVS